MIMIEMELCYISNTGIIRIGEMDVQMTETLTTSSACNIDNNENESEWNN